MTEEQIINPTEEYNIEEEYTPEYEYQNDNVEFNYDKVFIEDNVVYALDEQTGTFKMFTKDDEEKAQRLYRALID